METAKDFVLPTAEFGELRGKLVELSDIDALAKARIDSVKFLGEYSVGNERYLAFFGHNKNIFAKI